jgi:hypothetical protein
MGDVIEPWVLTARRYVKENKHTTLDEALRAAQEGQEELEAWRKHREKQRRPLVLTDQLDGKDDY